MAGTPHLATNQKWMDIAATHPVTPPSKLGTAEWHDVAAMANRVMFFRKLRLSEAAQELGASQSRLHAWIRSGVQPRDEARRGIIAWITQHYHTLRK